MDTALWWSARLHLAASAAFVLASVGEHPFVAALPAAIGLVLLVVRGRGSSELRVGILLGAHVLDQLAIGAQTAWSPGTVMISVILAVFAGLYLGWRGIAASGLWTALLIAIGGVVVLRGWRFPAVPDPNDPAAWFRATMFLTLIGSGGAVYMRSGVARLSGALATLTKAESALRSESEAVHHTRAVRRAAGAAVRQAQRLQGLQLLHGGMAQHVNNTMTVVCAAAEELRSELRTELRTEQDGHGAGPPLDRVRAIGAEVGQAVGRTAAVLRALLVLTREEGDDDTPADAASVVRELLGSVGDTLSDNLRVEIDAPGAPMVSMPAAPLRQLLLNLLLNAQHAMPEGGHVTIAIRSEAGEVVISVTDHGPGFSPEALARGTQAFFTTRRRPDGHPHTGLGLYVVQELVDTVGGTVELENRATSSTSSTSSTAGARVIVTLPSPEVATPDPAADPAAADPAAADPAIRWRDDAVHRLAWFTLVAELVGLVTTMVLMSPAHPIVPIVAVAAVPTALVWWAGDRWPTEARALIVAGVGLAGAGVGVLMGSFLMPSVIAVMVAMVWLLAGYARPVVWKLAMVGVIGVFAVAGTLPGPWPLRHHDPHVAGNWWRLALMFPIAQLLAATLVVDMMRAGRQALDRTERAVHRLELERGARREEAARLDATQTVLTQLGSTAGGGQVAGAVAHDVNNALSGVLGWAAVLAARDGPPTPDDIATAASVFDEAAVDTVALLAGLWLGAGARAPLDAWCDASAELARAEPLLRKVVGPERTLQLEAPDGPVGAGVSRSAVQRTLLNLVTNARDATGASGTIRVSVRQVGLAVQLRVADDGEGMDEATRSRVLEPFFTTKPRDRGTGLGLSTVVELATVFSGTVAVESERGRGTVVTVCWPARQPPGTAATDESHEGEAPPRPPATVLVLEDDDLVRATVVSALRRGGYTVVEAADGDQALERIRTHGELQGLVSDASFPGAPLPTVLDAFGAAFPGAPRIVASGLSPEGVQALVADRDVHLLPKPFRPSRLVAQLDGARAELTTPSA